VKNSDFKHSDLGKKIAKIMASGGLVPDDVMLKLLLKSLDEDIKKGIFNPERQILILDGIPRNISQAKEINGLLKVIKIIDIYISDDSVLTKRIAGRAKKDGRQEDGKIETIRKRLVVYKKETNKVLSHYPRKIITRINGLGAIKEIHRKINYKLKNCLIIN
jgi:adenylate kinase